MSDYWINSARRSQSHRPSNEFEAKVVGVTYENRQQVVRQLTPGETVWLRREPHNQFDPNAIRVERANGQQIGYIAKELARSLAAPLDRCGGAVSATVTVIVGGQYSSSSFGVRISFRLPDNSEDNGPAAPLGGYTADDF